MSFTESFNILEWNVFSIRRIDKRIHCGIFGGRMEREIEALRVKVKGLVLQEIRLYRLRESLTPEVMIEDISRSIEEMKREIVRWTRTMSYRERTSLLKKMMQEAVDEEIDRAIQLRKNRCLRCIHGRFYDQSGTPFIILPKDPTLVQTMGCELESDPEDICKRFIETASALSLEEYLDEVNLLYEFRQWVDRLEEIWQDYFIK